VEVAVANQNCCKQNRHFWGQTPSSEFGLKSLSSGKVSQTSVFLATFCNVKSNTRIMIIYFIIFVFCRKKPITFYFQYREK